MSYPFKSVYELFNKFRAEIIIGIVIIIFILLFIFDRKKEGQYKGIDGDYIPLIEPQKKKISKGEEKCKEVVEKYYNLPFKKVRPSFLKYKHGKNLELDLYNPYLNLAIEYNGRQHREFCPRFHKTEDDFNEQKERDNFKIEQCLKNGIKLIIVPDTVKYKDIEKYLIDKLEK
jgi:hypothetical protein